MKKIVSLLLCMALLCSMVVVVAHAEEAGAAMQVANVVAVLPGQVVSVDINVVNNPGIAALKIIITDKNSLGIFSAETVDDETTAIEDKTPKTTTLEMNGLANGILLWYGSADVTATTFGTLTFTVPSTAKAGTYTFEIATGEDAEQAVNSADDLLDIDGTSFTVTVVDKIITGVNVAIDASLAIGVHVLAADIEGVSITAVDVDGAEYATITDYEEVDKDNKEYVFYLNVNPWAMDVDFLVDFTDNFVITQEDTEEELKDETTGETIIDEETGKPLKVKEDVLDVTEEKLPKTAKTTGILSYCNAVKGTSDELDQLIADLLAFGQQAQIYNGAETPSYALPAGLTATTIDWEADNPDYDEEDPDSPETLTGFGNFCSVTFPEDLAPKTAKKKFKFVDATIEFGSRFVVTFSFANNGTTTASSLARVTANGETYTLDGWNLEYAFNPAEYAGTTFSLYASSTMNNTNLAAVNVYGPAHYAAYLNTKYGEDAADILAILEAFYIYGVSVEAYVATLGE